VLNAVYDGLERTGLNTNCCDRASGVAPAMIWETPPPPGPASRLADSQGEEDTTSGQAVAQGANISACVACSTLVSPACGSGPAGYAENQTTN